MAKYGYKKKADSKKKKTQAVLGLAILAAGLLVVLEKTHVINLYEKSAPNTTTATEERGVNDVDYSPASPTDNEDINQKKEDGTIGETTSPPTEDTAIQITFIANGQDADGGPLVIRTLLGGVTDGSCQLKLTKDNKTVTKSMSIVRQNTTYSCNLDVPFAELEAGEWKIELKVITSDGRTNAATAETTLG